MHHSHILAREPKKALAEARQIMLKPLTLPEEIYFIRRHESDNWAIKGLAFLDTYKRATITSAIEHHAVPRACEAIKHLKILLFI